MPINAVLQRLVLASPNPQDLARFYHHAFAYSIASVEAEWRCEGDQRSLWIRPGAANQLLESHFTFAEVPMLERFARELEGRGAAPQRSESGAGLEISVQDPEGRSVHFSVAESSHKAPRQSHGVSLPARLQHYAVRTPTPAALHDFYVNRLGFTCSDLVCDESGDLTAAFLRTDREHHSLALFRAPHQRFDHFSCETESWSALRDWADFLAGRSVPLAWGIGRHGPGNDTFLMVQDPDGNLAEISAELEVCAEDRPIGRWPHRMETLNQWGIAIMRS
jgi:catechol 2,3-dioxygenase